MTAAEEPADAPGARAGAARARDDMSSLERFLRFVLLFALLYAFLAAVDILGTGLAGLGEDFVDTLFRGIENPLVGLFVGTLATVLAQSSSVTTPTVVSLVGTGVIGVPAAVPIIMGANIGTTVTNTLASIGSIRRPEEFRRAFTGATMHDVFNVTIVLLFLPLELLTGFLSRTAVALSSVFGDTTTGEFRSPAKAAVGFVSDAAQSVAQALVGPGTLSGVLLIALGLAIIFGSLVAITKNMRVVVAGPAERSLNAVLGRSGSLGIVVGAVLTVSVQSSSISTSLLIPMIAAGVLTLENAYPITLGANIGTTITALLAALAVDRIEGLQIALVHLLFNVCGVLLLYPIPAIRRLPLRIAAVIARAASERRSLVFVYVVLAFYIVPLVGILVLR
jgi:solute carrier family 34 (sodium-dependent phosphate cotransporter)